MNEGNSTVKSNKHYTNISTLPIILLSLFGLVYSGVTIDISSVILFRRTIKNSFMTIFISFFQLIFISSPI